jgi:hypothetical protein
MNNMLMIEEMESIVAPDDVADFLGGAALGLAALGFIILCCGGC